MRVTLPSVLSVYDKSRLDEVLAYIFATKPKASGFAPEIPVLISKNIEMEGDEVDLRAGQWWQQPRVAQGMPGVSGESVSNEYLKLSFAVNFHYACEIPAFYTQECPMSTLKTQAVSVRVEPHIKEALQTAASREMRSLANMMEVMVVAYCRANGYPLVGVPDATLPTAKPRKPS